LENRHRNVLKAFYSVFKAADSHLQFVLLTGVTKFSQVSVFSGFNQPKDISMDARYEALCGITQEELEHYFAEPIARMAEEYRCTVEKMKLRLKAQYDGYHFSKRLTDIYNPFSLLNAMDSLSLDDYWFRSGTPTYLIRLLSHFDENLNELTNKYYSPEEFIDYKADVEKPLPMIYQSGYLTVKDYDKEFNTFLLDFPNNEVKNGFLTMLASSYLKPSEETGSWVRSVVTALRRGELDKVRELFTSFLAGIPYTMRRKENEAERERYFQYTFYLIMRLISVVFEFKLDGTAAEALQQIHAKGYVREYSADPRRVYQIGAAFSSETGTISDWRVE
ncbi:AAA family ATPase, partial [uncultured Bacteroides sp.]|uniref:AAA family ATPase n=1 Tax=uncultured Bacteroides sp. TaxID=162156 RepID=UPI00260C7959